ncbi:MAG: poly-gamma-glutamate biosynthesis protein PgsC [Prolixibacteraceae bacterium]
MILQLFIIGLMVGFVFYEWTGISPGGVIVPAYFALFIHDYARIAVTIILAILVFGIIKFLSGYLLIYGRRKFLIAVLLGFFLKLLIETQIQPLAMIKLDLQSIGYIIPGIIANEIGRQKMVPTLLGLGIVTVIILQISYLII